MLILLFLMYSKKAKTKKLGITELKNVKLQVDMNIV